MMTEGARDDVAPAPKLNRGIEKREAVGSNSGTSLIHQKLVLNKAGDIQHSNIVLYIHPYASPVQNTSEHFLHAYIFSWFKKRDKSRSAAGVRSGSNESVSSPPAKGVKKNPDKSGVVTGSLRINVSGLSGSGQEKAGLQSGPELDIPYIEDTSASKPKVPMQFSYTILKSAKDLFQKPNFYFFVLQILLISSAYTV